MSTPPPPPEIRCQLPSDPRPRIVNEIAAFLADSPLYRPYEYEGNLWSRDRGGFSFSFPSTVRLYCSEEVCRTTQVWEVGGGPYLGGNSTVVETFSSATFER